MSTTISAEKTKAEAKASGASIKRALLFRARFRLSRVAYDDG